MSFKITEVAKLLKEHNIKLLLWEEPYSKCLLKERVVMLPMEYLDPEKLLSICLALAHEIEHINHTTFDVERIAKMNTDEFFIFNCIEDVRLDMGLIAKYDIEDLYRKVYIDRYQRKPFKRKWSFFQQVGWGAILSVLSMTEAVKLTKKVQRFIKKHDIIAKFLRGAGLLDKLEEKPTDKLYLETREHIEALTIEIREAK